MRKLDFSIGCWREHYSIARAGQQASRRRKPRRRGVAAVLLISAMSGALARGQTEDPGHPDATAPATPTHFRPLAIVGNELRIYLDDSVALVAAPFHWTGTDWLKAGAVGVGIAGAMAYDERLAAEIQERRSPATDRLSTVTTSFGTTQAFAISAVLIGSGVVFKDANVTSMGREAIEASIFTGLIAAVAKRAFGRQRPIDANDETVFLFGSSNQSFPSGHTTEAFTVASVIAARSSGWVVPTLAYTVASLVAYDRLNDRQHFPSDVVAGAALGISVGRFVVHRHQPREAAAPKVELQIVPIRDGASLVARF
jgi:hypothetical protein